MIKFRSITIDGFRTLKNFKLDLDGLHVLIGENGSGKSTVVETFEIYRRFWSREFWGEFHKIHGGSQYVFGDGKSGSIEVELEVHAPTAGSIRHRVEFAKHGTSEQYDWTPAKQEHLFKSLKLSRGISSGWYAIDDGEHIRLSPEMLNHRHSVLIDLLPSLGDAHHLLNKVILERLWLCLIDVQLPFQTGCYWGTQSTNARTAPMRDTVTVAPSSKLERFGTNLPNVFHTIREASSDDEWLETMELVRAGLGDWVERVNTPADAGGGRIGLALKVRGRDQQIPAYTLSDGQLNYLAFVALARAKTERSILVFDEIDLHLHPSMIGRVMSLMKMIAEHTPVLLTTHSRTVLNTLDDPAKQITVLELDPTNFTTVARQYNEESLKLWLERYESVSAVLDSGNEELLFRKPSTVGAGS